MARQAEHSRFVEVGAPAPASATITRTTGDEHAGEGTNVRMFGDVDPAIQLKMELIVRASANPETALPFVIALLVEGDERCEAIVTAISDNAALREQWHRTWEVLRR